MATQTITSKPKTACPMHEQLRNRVGRTIMKAATAILASVLLLSPLTALAAAEPSQEVEALYNGIRLPAGWPRSAPLPADWPPRSAKQPKPMPMPYLRHPPKVIPIDIGRQLFVDDFLIGDSTLARVWHQPQKHPNNPILKPETPLELQKGFCPVAAPFSDGVFYDPKDRLFKMWYHAGWFDGTGFATSRDGVEWKRAELDVVPGTNRVIPDRDQMRRDGASVWLDHGAKLASERFKMFLFTRTGTIGTKLTGEQKGHILTSPDGIHWDFRGATGMVGDNTTFFYNPFRKKWVFSIRYNIRNKSWRQRVRQYWECDDLLQAVQSDGWRKNPPIFWIATDAADQPDPAIGDTPQLYKLDAVAYESVILGLVEILLGPDGEKCFAQGLPKITELQVAFSRDGFYWDRPCRKPFIAPSRKPGDWQRGYISSAGGCCLIVGDKLHFYYGAFMGDETLTNNTPWNGMYAHGATGLAILRRDGFASMDAGTGTGTLTTRPVTFSGKYLFVNVNSPEGALRAEVLDENGKAIEPFTLEDCRPIVTDSVRQQITWNGGSDLSGLKDRAVRFRFELTNGSLYAFWVSPDIRGASHGYTAAGGPGFTGPTDTVGFQQRNSASTK
jgi:hypothetical protein